MAEEITKYTVSVSFDAALKKLNSFEKKMTAFSKSQENSLKVQIGLQRQLNRLRNANTGKHVGGSLTKDSVTTPPDSMSGKKPSTPDKMNAHMKERERHLVRVQKAEERRVMTLNKALASVKRTAFYRDKDANSSREGLKAALREKLDTAKTADQVRDMVAATRQRLRYNKLNEKSYRKQNFILRRMKESSKQYAGNMVGTFAIAAGIATVTKTGQQFEGIDSALLAVSGSAALAGENLQFVKDESLRLGKPLKESADAFSKMLAARGNLSAGEVKKTFTAMNEVAVVLGLTADQANRGNRAISQMMSKGKVSAEELRLQLAEAGFANAIPEMVKSAQDIGLISKELGLVQATSEFYNLQQQGKVITEEILPAFSKRMKEFASGGLAEKLKSNAVAMGKMMNAWEQIQNMIFKSGFGEGLTELFNTLSKSGMELSELWEGLGKILGGVFRIAAKAIAAITPTLAALGGAFNSLSDALGEVGAGFLALTPFSYTIFKIAKALNPVVLMFTAMATAIETAAMWLEEIVNVFTGGKIGILNTTGEAMNFGTGSDAIDLFKNTNLDQVPFIKNLDLLNKLRGGLANNFNDNYSNPQNLNVVLEVDGERLAGKLGETESFGNSVQGWQQPMFQ